MTSRPTPDLTIAETRVYRGANVWSYDQAIHLVVDLGSLEEFPTNKLPGFTEHLLKALPGLANHSCSRGRRGGFVERLEEGTWLGHVAEHCALALQQVVGHDIRRGKTRGVKGQKGRYNVIYGYVDEQVGLAAGKLAVRLLNHLVQADPSFDWETELESFILRAERTAFGPSTQAIIDEAVSRDIPWIRLNQHSLVQLGQGVHAKRIRATMTSETASIAVDIASDKDLTTRLLGAAGLPVPKQESVRSEDAAVASARRIGFPVVIKPLDGNHGRGVCLNLQSDNDVRAAYPVAKEQSRRGTCIVESFVTGKDYRCLAVLSARLDALVAHGLLTRSGDGHPDYALTEEALGLWPAIHALAQWGERRTTPGRPRRLFSHVGCGPLAVEGRCEACGRSPEPADIEIRPGPGADLTMRDDPVSVALREPHRLLTPLVVR